MNLVTFGYVPHIQMVMWQKENYFLHFILNCLCNLQFWLNNLCIWICETSCSLSKDSNVNELLHYYLPRELYPLSFQNSSDHDSSNQHSDRQIQTPKQFSTALSLHQEGIGMWKQIRVILSECAVFPESLNWPCVSSMYPFY